MPLAAALVPAIAGGISSLIGSKQASKAVNTQVAAGETAKTGIQDATTAGIKSVNDATTGANDRLTDLYGEQTDNLSPYLQAGQQGITSLADMLKPGGELTKQFSFNPEDLSKTPGYQFALQQGTQAANRGSAARGLGVSGNRDAAVAEFGSGLAQKTWGDEYARAFNTFQANRNNALTPLSMLISSGQTATGQFNQASEHYGDTTGTNDIYAGTYEANAGRDEAKSIADIVLGQGNAKAAGSVAQGNIWGSEVNRLGTQLPGIVKAWKGTRGK